MLQKSAVTPQLWQLLTEISPLAAQVGFALAGGTNLALRLGHRLSIDIDFFAYQAFEKDDVKKLISKHLGVEAILMNETKQSLRFIIQDIKTEFLLHEYPLIAAIQMTEGIPLYSLSDVAAMKINAVIGRGAKKDFWDIAALLNTYSLPKLMALYNQKYQTADASLILRTLSYFEDAETEPDPVTNDGQQWHSVKKIIAKAIQEYN